VKTFALAVLILTLGTVAMRSFTHAGNTPQKSVAGSTLIDLDQLTSDDLARLQGDILDHGTRLSDHDIRLSAIDAKIIELQTKLSDCNKLSVESAETVVAMAKSGSHVPSATKSPAHSGDSDVWLEALKRMPTPKYSSGGGGSTGTATRNVYQSVASPRPQASGGSTGSATANVYQQSAVVYSPQPTVSYVEQPVQYTVQQSAPQQDTGFLSRTVTNSSSVASPQCYIDANGNSVCPSSVQSAQTSRTTTLSRPRLFRR
jgi:hypothetical protein